MNENYDQPVRIELGNGQWWDIKPRLTRGARKAVNRVVRSWITIRDTTAESLTADPETAVQIDPAKVDIDSRDDMLLKLGTVGWSFPQAFSLEAVDDFPDEYVEKVLTEMRSRYLVQPDAGIELSKKG